MHVTTFRVTLVLKEKQHVVFVKQENPKNHINEIKIKYPSKEHHSKQPSNKYVKCTSNIHY